MTEKRHPLGIYIHIPFCIKKCAYCDFLSMQADKQVIDKYIVSLEKDIDKTVTADLLNQYEVNTVFIGGGTPSSLSEKQLQRLGYALQSIFQKMKVDRHGAEITMECNPGTLNNDKVKIMKEYGINRISLGLQSADNRELELLGRIHKYSDFVYCYELLRRHGFDNINVDVMSALPMQTIETYEKTLISVAQLNPEHISAYSLIVEEDTPFFERYSQDDMLRSSGKTPFFLPDEESERIMYEQTEEILNRYGYHRYEISNYAKKGYESVHNIGYWRGREYIGIGLGASSYICRHIVDVDNNNSCSIDSGRCTTVRRFNRTRDLNKYLTNDFGEYETENLDINMQMEEFMFLGLRMIEGVSINEFADRFGTDIYKIYSEPIARFERLGLLESASEGIIRLTKKGIDVSNYVFEGFLFS